MAPLGSGGNGSVPEDSLTPWYIGHHESTRSLTSASALLRDVQDQGYDMLTVPITTSHFRRRITGLVQDHIQRLLAAAKPSTIPLPLVPSLMPSDTVLGPEDGNSALIAVTSPWIDLGSRDSVIAHVSRLIFKLEVTYAAFCGISNLLVRGPLDECDVVQYARNMAEALAMGNYLHIHVQIPMYGELEDADQEEEVHLSELAESEHAKSIDLPDEDGGTDLDFFRSWDTWNSIRSLCNYSTRLSVALELPRQLPSSNLQSRWFSETLRIVTLPRTTFLRNAKGYPVLSRAHQQMLSRFSRLRFMPWVLLGDADPISDLVEDYTAQEAPPSGQATKADPTPAEAAITLKETSVDLVPHLRYLRHLQQGQPFRPPMERFGQGYQDYLQSPLQPLTDNLESITYEVFEKDPIKYEWYEKATALALRDVHTAVGQREIMIAVVGSGRGPLVSRALLASKQTGISVKVWAVEKNPNAHVLLQRRAVSDSLWRGNVTVVKTDMRAWKGPVVDAQVRKVDIMISELLGSFADNELSPECLDGVQHVLHPKHGVNIPQSYSAHFTPISTPKIQQDLLHRSGGLNGDKWEIPYVVMLQQYHNLCSQDNVDPASTETPDVREAWSFSHPISPDVLAQAKARADGSVDAGGAGGAFGGDGSNEHNTRYCKSKFLCADRGICHGLAGYFETVLYTSNDGNKKVELSTNPVTMESKSKDMISWFPIFFPLKTPLYVPDKSEMEVSMWRQTDDRKVWYEWLVEIFETQNKQRRRLGMSELHSSRNNGCLM